MLCALEYIQQLNEQQLQSFQFTHVVGGLAKACTSYHKTMNLKRTEFVPKFVVRSNVKFILSPLRKVYGIFLIKKNSQNSGLTSAKLYIFQ